MRQLGEIIKNGWNYGFLVQSIKSKTDIFL